MLTANDYDCSNYFGEKAIPTSKPPETISIKLRADKHETEEFYLTVSIPSTGRNIFEYSRFNSNPIKQHYAHNKSKIHT